MRVDKAIDILRNKFDKCGQCSGGHCNECYDLALQMAIEALENEMDVNPTFEKGGDFELLLRH